jgi:hypothetical protein
MLDEVTLLFDETNEHHSKSTQENALFISAVRTNLQNRLAAKGHLFLNEAYDALGFPRTPEGAVSGWISNENCRRDLFEWNQIKFSHALALKFKTDGLMFHRI